NAAAEIDLSSEWDDALTIEADVPLAEAAETGKQENYSPEKTAETVEEIRFYLQHGMPEQASEIFEKLQNLTDDQATLAALRNEIAAASHPASATEEVAAV